MSKLEQQYKQNVKAYKDMDLDIPVDFETVKSKLSKHQKETISKGTGQLVICPALTQDFTFYDLIKRFDKKQKIDTYVYKDLWNQYDLSQAVTIGVVNLKGDNSYDDDITTHTNKTLEEQRMVKGEFLSPVESVILAAILRLAGKNLAPKTFIRFPQLENKSVDGVSLVGYVDSDGDRLGFAGTYGDADPGVGVGLSVGTRINLSPSTSPLPSAILSFSETEAIELLKQAGYKIWKEF